jgi:hypothetical protein
MKRLLPILICLLHYRNPVQRGLVMRPRDWEEQFPSVRDRGDGCGRDRIAMDGASPGAGSFPTARMRSAEENSRPSEARTDHPRG